jgi:hypothetical protein
VKKGPAYLLTWVSDSLAVGGAPMSYDQLDSLREQGISAILNLCGEFCDLHELEAAHGFEVRYLPIPDEEAPDLAELEKALAWLDEAIYLGKKALIHCRHGIGRTGTVLNAYLLRRGLGRKLAGRTLKGLRARPANFEQWWTVRKYGKASGRLTIREPSLEFRNPVDLGPFFGELEGLEAWAEERVLAEAGEGERCGRDHARCCAAPPALGLAEAARLTRTLNTALDSAARLGLIERAAQACRLRQEREQELAVSLAPGEAQDCPPGRGECPLLEAGKCLVYAQRPLACRVSGLEPPALGAIWGQTLAPGLERLSRELFLAMAGAFPPRGLPAFPLADVVSGRYVSQVFRLLAAAQKRAGARAGA